MRNAFIIAGKDLRQRLRDRSAILLGVIAPFGLAAILGTLLPTGEETTTHVHRYAVVDQDRGPVARTFVRQVLDPLHRQDFAEVSTAPSPQAAASLAREGRLAAAFVIPPGFSRATISGQPAELRIIGNSDARIATQIAVSVAEGFASQVNAIRLSVATVVSAEGRPPPPEAARRMQARAAALPSPVVMAGDPAASKELDANTFFSAGMGVFFLFFTAQFAVLSLLNERREGTLARLLAAPLSPGVIVAAKALSTFIFGLMSMTVIVVASSFILGASWGSPLGVATLIVAAVVSAMGLSSLVASLARTNEQAMGYSQIMAVTLGILGGTFFPVSQGPGFLSKLSLLTPHAWLMRGFADLSGGASLGEVFPSVLALLVFGCVVGGVALLFARRVMQP